MTGLFMDRVYILLWQCLQNLSVAIGKKNKSGNHHNSENWKGRYPFCISIRSPSPSSRLMGMDEVPSRVEIWSSYGTDVCWSIALPGTRIYKLDTILHTTSNFLCSKFKSLMMAWWCSHFSSTTCAMRDFFILYNYIILQTFVSLYLEKHMSGTRARYFASISKLGVSHLSDVHSF